MKRLVDRSAHCPADSKSFLAVYVLSNGVVRAFVVASLLLGRLRAYPGMILLLIVFIVYQVYRYYFTHAFWLLLLTAFDLTLIFLIRSSIPVKNRE